MTPSPTQLKLREQIEQLANRGIILNGSDYAGGLYQNPQSDQKVSVDAANRDFLLMLAKAQTGDQTTEEGRKAYNQAHAEAVDLIKSAWGDPQKMRILNAIRLETVNNYIMAKGNFMSMFEIVTLKDDEIPYVANETMQEIACGYIATDGTPRRFKIEKPQAQNAIDLRYVTSRRVGYRTLDIYKGDIGTVAQRTFDIAFDLSFQLDKNCYTLLTAALGSGGAFGAFTLTGSKPTRVFVNHSGILASTHLPTTNDIDMTANGTWPLGDGTSTSATFAPPRVGAHTIIQIVKYADQWGDVFPDGRITPTGEIIVPAIDTFGFLNDLNLLTSSTRPNSTPTTEALNNSGYLTVNIAGRNWRIIPDVTIPSGFCFPKFNKTPGRVYLKPGLDEEFVYTDREKHWEERSQQKVFGAYIINQKRMNVLRIKYK